MMFDIQRDMNTAHGIARMFAPYDTGNLRFNAIKSSRTNDGFVITYSLVDAFYIYFLEEGTTRKGGMRHVGFISNKTVPAIANYLYTKYELKDKKKAEKIRYMAYKSHLDIDIDSQRRENRNKFSLSIDLDRLANMPNKEWQHNPNNEVFDEDWKRGDFFD